VGYAYSTGRPYPQMYPQERAVLMSERCRKVPLSAPDALDVYGRLRTSMDDSPGRIRSQFQVHDPQQTSLV